ncbi:hypothetical protein V494_00176 [Pseudogymnoascus sp. VKM F-4513 (FW-928)]|nr:hypothetical protein V494_00176 [Pseudogymnoascus sp. VKM F-4513 (FW-928)]
MRQIHQQGHVRSLNGPRRPQRGTTNASRPRIGRSGPRSRAGCMICKQRRVRCDELHPVCGHCSRLQLDCVYKPPSQTWQKRKDPAYRDDGINGVSTDQQAQSRSNISGSDGVSDGVQLETQHANVVDDPSPLQQRLQSSQNITDTYDLPSLSTFGFYPRSRQATPNQFGQPGLSWVDRFDVNDILADLNTSWAGEFSCMLTDGGSPLNSSLYPVENDSRSEYSSVAVGGELAQAGGQTLQPSLWNTHETIGETNNQLGNSSSSQRPRQQMRRRHSNESLSPSPPELLNRRASNDDSHRLIHSFRKIVQPPAAILIGGYERWHRLQHYLCKLSDQSRAVNSSLLCVIELLMIDELSKEPGQNRDICMKRILERHADACLELERKLNKHKDLKLETREHLLGAIFLLSWFEVIRDQDSQSNLFPRDLADIVITTDTSWSRYSRQLLCWLNTLDNKATHLGGKHLLLPRSLEIASHYPPQITSEQQCDDAHGKEQDGDSELSWSDWSPGDSHHSPEEVNSHPPLLKLGKVKQVMLNTILQPALEWYLTSQSYCRRISAHDKHHRKRFTSDDEYEVITACKQLESELFELWDCRPAIISTTADQLATVVSPDIATRLEEVFSVYLASFWILFVYLHRVSWWNLPHSLLTKRAMGEVWQHLQRAYGEEVNGPLRRIIHPSLLWPLFLFGSECPDPVQRTWAIEQLEALGEAKPALPCDVENAETLPAFKLGSGATRNARRAAVLLRELIKEQDEKQMRVDDRDLSMKMFGCYFSIV